MVTTRRGTLARLARLRVEVNAPALKISYHWVRLRIGFTMGRSGATERVRLVRLDGQIGTDSGEGFCVLLSLLMPRHVLFEDCSTTFTCRCLLPSVAGLCVGSGLLRVCLSPRLVLSLPLFLMGKVGLFTLCL